MILEFFLFLTTFILYVAWYVITNEKHKRDKNYPPGAIDFPFVGGLFQGVYTAGMKGQLQHYERVHRVAQKYGKICSVRGGTQHGVIVEDYAAAKEVLGSADFSHRFPSHPRFKEHMLDQNYGLMWSSGDAHKELRRFTVRTLKEFGFGELKQAEVFLQEELSELVTLLDKLRSSNDKNEVRFSHVFKIPSFNILWRVMAGYRFTGEDKKIIELIHAVDDIAGINIGIDPEWAFPFLRYIPGCSPSRAKRPSFVICHEFFLDIAKKRRETNTFLETQYDFIDHLLKQIDTEKNNPKSIYTDGQFSVTCVDLLFGGLDTTANSIEFALLYLVKYPWVQKKAQEEIDRVVGRDRVPSVLDRSKLRYCEALLWETLRVANIIPCNGRTANTDTKVGPYNVKEDVFTGIINTVIHMDPEIWDDPETFRPERFLDQNNNFINTEKILAFGGGKRLCIGMPQAKVIWLVFITGILQRFNFEQSPDHPELSIVPIPGVANSPRPFYCLVTPRI